MFRLWRAFWAKVQGFFGRKADAMQEDPDVMAATFDRAIDKKEANFGTVKNAVATLVGMKTKKIKEIEELTGKVDKLSKIKAAAQAKLKARAAQIVAECKAAGITDKAAVQQKLAADPEYVKHQGTYNDMSSSLTDSNEDIERKRAKLEDIERKVATHKAQLQQMQRNIENLSETKVDAIAQTQLAKEMEEVDAVLAGVATTQEDKDLQAALAARDRAVARAEVTSELAGNDAQLAEDEYLEYANQIEANSELDALIDLDSMLADGNDLDPAQLPE